MPRTPDRTQPNHLLCKGVPPVDGPIRPSRPIRTDIIEAAPIALPSVVPERPAAS